MKLTIVVPSEEYKQYAGARIRYKRLTPELARHGIGASIEEIGRFDPFSDFDAVLISKCHDARSLIVAAAASDRGKLVGVDLFDDYFSDPTDSRLVRYRSWLAQLITSCDFALCSTEAMATVVRRYRSGLPTHVMNDPAPQHDPEALRSLLASKLWKARDEARIRVAWFGLGDNPYFRVGLSDLAAYGTALAELGKNGRTVELTVLTNRRALTAEGLSLIGQLPVAADVREWSDAAEVEVLRDALVAFLPVNAQPFSAAKSLNRAFTAFSCGCQVLSVGYPLYRALESLIYDDPEALIADLDRGSLRLAAGTMDQYLQTLEALGSPQIEASRLAAFLAQFGEPTQRAPLPMCTIHGHSSHADVHRLTQALGGLSVASPYCSATWNFDVVFRASASGPRMLVSRRASRRLLPHVRARLKGSERIGGEQFQHLPAGQAGVADAPSATIPWHQEPVALQLATYTSMIRQIARLTSDAFGPCRPILSETSQVPFPAVTWAA